MNFLKLKIRSFIKVPFPGPNSQNEKFIFFKLVKKIATHSPNN